MKKIIIGLLLVISIITISGCTNKVDRKGIDKLLRKEEIIHSEDELIEQYTNISNQKGEQLDLNQYNIYENTEGEYFAIEYIYDGKSENYNSFIGGKEYYTIRIYDDIERKKCCEEENEIECEKCLPGETKKEFIIDEPEETYKVSKKRTLFIKSYKIEE